MLEGFGVAKREVSGVEWFGLDSETCKICPGVGEGRHEGGLAEYREDTLRGYASLKVFCHLAHPWCEPRMGERIRVFWCPEEDRVVSQRPVYTREYHVEHGGTGAWRLAPHREPKRVRVRVRREGGCISGRQPSLDIGVAGELEARESSIGADPFQRMSEHDIR